MRVLQKKPLWAIGVLIAGVICVTPVILFMIITNGNYGCFGTFFPTLTDVARSGWVSFPPSAQKITWQAEGFQCIASIDFEMIPSDLDSFLRTMSFEKIEVTTDSTDPMRQIVRNFSAKEGEQQDWTIFPSSNFILGIRSDGRFSQNVLINRTDPKVFRVEITSNQWSYSTTRLYDQTPGWFDNFVTPSPIPPK